MAKDIPLIWLSGKAKYFLFWGLDAISVNQNLFARRVVLSQLTAQRRIKRGEVLFRPVVVTEGRDLTIPLPKFDVMSIDQASGALGGIFFAFEGEIDAIDNVPIGIEDVSVVAVHRLACSPQTNSPARCRYAARIPR
jgi:hypothetical protein